MLRRLSDITAAPPPAPTTPSRSAGGRPTTAAAATDSTPKPVWQDLSQRLSGHLKASIEQAAGGGGVAPTQPAPRGTAPANSPGACPAPGQGAP